MLQNLQSHLSAGDSQFPEIKRSGFGFGLDKKADTYALLDVKDILIFASIRGFFFSVCVAMEV